MPTFSTPTPIDLAINLPVGAITVIASDRTDTIVTVEPTSPSKAVDRRGAEETKVEHDGQRITVTGPKPRFAIIGPSESIDVTVEVPTGSRLTAEISVGGVRTTGRLGATRIKALTGSADIDGTGDLSLRAGHGSVAVASADGTLDITADHGQVAVGAVSGDATVAASHGSISIGEAGGDVTAKTAYGDLEITTARASVSAKTAYGTVRIREVSSGSISVESGYGQLAVGVKPGVAAWLDLAAKNGRVRNDLTTDTAPDSSEETVAVRARSQFGDITITRSTGKDS